MSHPETTATCGTHGHIWGALDKCVMCGVPRVDRTDNPKTTAVTVPRWALDYLLQHADCDDAGGHQSSEMIAARYYLELAMEKQPAPDVPQNDREFQVWEYGRRQGVREGVRNQRPRLGYRIDTHGDAAVIVWNEGGCRPASREECEMWSYLASG